jgi:hypothetical protein
MEHKPQIRKNQVAIFGNPVAFRKPLKQSGHVRPFTRIIEVDELHVCRAASLSKTEMAAVVAALVSHVPDAAKLAGVVQVFVYTTVQDGSATEISIDNTHAFSILTTRGQRLRHHYFEKQSFTAFKELASFSRPLVGPFDLDDIRLLHFAKASQRGLPVKSTIYEFNSGAWGDKHWVWEKNIQLRIAVLRDPKRNWGAPTLGIYGDAVYRAITGADDENCSGFADCPSGKKSCGFGPAGPDLVC